MWERVRCELWEKGSKRSWTDWLGDDDGSSFVGHDLK